MRIIGGVAKGKKISQPIDKKTRPPKDIVRESIFNILNHSNLLNKSLNDCFVLDLFSGVGSFGLEAISRGVKKVIFFEEHKGAIDLLFKNIKILNFNEKAEIVKKNIYKNNSFNNLNYKFDIIFIDPPFKDKNIKLVFNNLYNAKLINSKTLLILHRHKSSKDDLENIITINREEIYGLSKIIFGFFNF